MLFDDTAILQLRSFMYQCICCSHVFLLPYACSVPLEAWFHSAHGMSTIAEFVGTRQGPNNAVKGWFGEEESAKDGTSMLEYLGG